MCVGVFLWGEHGAALHALNPTHQTQLSLALRARSGTPPGLLLAFVGVTYTSVIRRSSSGKEFLEEFEREIAEESARQAAQRDETRGPKKG